MSRRSACLGPERLLELADGAAADPPETEHLAACAICANALARQRADLAVLAELSGTDAAATPDFGVYRQCVRIATGGMSVVYRGLAPDGRAVAVKVCRHPALLPFFRREAEALVRCGELGISGVMPLLAQDLGHVPPYLVTPFADGGSLEERLRPGVALPAAEVMAIMRSLAGTLCDLAAHGIVHGDLKPANIVIDAGCYRLIDLGIARNLLAHAAQSEPRLTSLAQTPMTVAYSSPERIRGATAGEASDIFSLGILLHELATGCHPFAGGTEWETAARILAGNGSYKLRPDALGQVIRLCLEPTPDRRPSAAWLATWDGRPVTQRLLPTYLVTTARHLRRFTTRPGVLIMILLAATLAGALTMAVPTDPPMPPSAVAPGETPALTAAHPSWMQVIESGLQAGDGLVQRLDPNRITIIVTRGDDLSEHLEPALTLGRRLGQGCQLVVIEVGEAPLRLTAETFPCGEIPLASPQLNQILGSLDLDYGYPRLLVFDRQGQRIDGGLLLSNQAVYQELVERGSVDLKRQSDLALERLRGKHEQAAGWPIFVAWRERFAAPNAKAGGALGTEAQKAVAEFIADRIAHDDWDGIRSFLRLLWDDLHSEFSSPFDLHAWQAAFRATALPPDPRLLIARLDGLSQAERTNEPWNYALLLAVVARDAAERGHPGTIACLWRNLPAPGSEPHDAILALDPLLVQGDQRAFDYLAAVLAQHPALCGYVRPAIAHALAAGQPRARDLSQQIGAIMHGNP